MAARLAGAAAVALAVLAGSCTSPGVRPAPPAAEVASGPEAISRGREHYLTYCRNCHGTYGEGDGQLAALLKVSTPDLTGIAARNGGAYPARWVRDRIDGTESVPAHGDRFMPVWGVVLDPARGAGGEEERVKVLRQLDEIVLYLESIQGR